MYFKDQSWQGLVERDGRVNPVGPLPTGVVAGGGILLLPGRDQTPGGKDTPRGVLRTGHIGKQNNEQNISDLCITS